MTAFSASPEQQTVIGADLVGQQVLACAGSGKTSTSVRRLVEIRRRLGDSRGYVALLSYSNIAVDTFRREFEELKAELPGLSNRVFIATVDSFVTSHILLPHASRVMGCGRRPYLVHGHEPFLKGFTVYNGTYSVGIEHLRVLMGDTGDLLFEDASGYGVPRVIDPSHAEAAIQKLGKSGAFTHELGRYWALMTLAKTDGLHRVLARRYPYILVDEAQDVGTMHGTLLSVLQETGSKVSLIGDPNQAIFDFANAHGSYLRNFDPGSDGLKHTLTENWRSAQPIVDLANSISGTSASSARPLPSRRHGAYLIRYKETGLDDLLPTFSAILDSAGYSQDDAAVLCRGTDLVERLGGAGDETGQGATDRFARAAICRDRHGDIADAFAFAVDGVVRVLANPPSTLRSNVVDGSSDPIPKVLRRLVWRFLKSNANGIPAATRKAKTDWLPALKKNLEGLLAEIDKECHLAMLPSWTHNVTARQLSDAPLWKQELIETDTPRYPVKTVHQAKGESIGAVLYVAKSKDIKNLLLGPVGEEGRIGYVAITRARDLLILAIPDGISGVSVAELQAKGFAIWS